MSTSKKLISCVLPGVFDVRASLLLFVSVLMALDLPALLRPANAISMPSSGGQVFKDGALVT